MEIKEELDYEGLSPNAGLGVRRPHFAVFLPGVRPKSWANEVSLSIYR